MEKFLKIRDYFLELKEKEELWNVNYAKIAKEFQIANSTVRNYFYNFLYYDLNYPEEKIPNFKKIRRYELLVLHKQK